MTTDIPGHQPCPVVRRQTDQQAADRVQYGLVTDREPFWSLEPWDQLLAPFSNFFPVDDGCAAAVAALQPQHAAVIHLSPTAAADDNITTNDPDHNALLETLTNIFLGRLHPSTPFVKRSYLPDNLRAGRQDRDAPFNALIHASAPWRCCSPSKPPTGGTARGAPRCCWTGPCACTARQI